MTLLLVRHAVAKARHRWDDDDTLRPLNSRGREQASALVRPLRDYPIDRVLSSPAVRCVDTVAPLAESFGLRVEVDKALDEGSARRAVRLVEGMLAGGEDAALCSHGDVIPAVLDAFGIQWRRCAKGSTWVLESRSNATYLLPPA